jgi:hypothetical protein
MERSQTKSAKNEFEAKELELLGACERALLWCAKGKKRLQELGPPWKINLGQSVGRVKPSASQLNIS